MKKVYKVIVGPADYEDGSPSFHAYCPALKGARTHGRSREEALDNIRRLVQMVVDEIVDEATLRERADLTKLFPVNVDAVVEIPGGSWPTSSRPGYAEDAAALRSYAAEGVLTR